MSWLVLLALLKEDLETPRFNMDKLTVLALFSQGQGVSFPRLCVLKIEPIISFLPVRIPTRNANRTCHVSINLWLPVA